MVPFKNIDLNKFKSFIKYDIKLIANFLNVIPKTLN